MNKNRFFLLAVFIVIFYGCSTVPTFENEEERQNLLNQIRMDVNSSWDGIYSNDFSGANDMLLGAVDERLPNAEILRGLSLNSFFLNNDFSGFDDFVSAVGIEPYSPRTVAMAHFVEEFYIYDNEDYREYIKLLGNIIRRKDIPDWVRNEYGRIMFDYYYYNSGEAGKCLKLKDKLSLVEGWELLGPFSNVSGSGFGKDFVAIDSEKSGFKDYSSGLNNREITPYTPAVGNTGILVPVSDYYSSTAMASIYAMNDIETEETGIYELVFSRAGSIEVWLDGEKIIADDHYTNGDNAFYLRKELAYGKHRIIVKCNNRDEYSGFSLALYPVYGKEYKSSDAYNSLFNNKEFYDPFIDNLCKDAGDSDGLGEANFWLYYSLLRKGWYEEAREFLQKAEKNEDSMIQQWQEAQLDRAFGDWVSYEQKMLMLAEAPVRFAPALSFALNNYIVNKRYDKARDRIEEAGIKGHDWYYNLLYEMKLLLMTEEYDEAMDVLDRLERHYPGYTYHYAVMLRYNNNMSSRQIRNCISHLYNGFYYSALFYDYRVTSNSGSYKDARKKIEEYLEHYPVEEGVWIDYLNVLKGDPSVSLNDLRKETSKMLEIFPISYVLLNEERSQARYFYTELYKIFHDPGNGTPPGGLITKMGKEKTSYKEALERIVEIYPLSLSLRDKLRELNGEKEFIKEIGQEDSYSIIEEFNESGFEYEDNDAVIVYDDRREIFFGDGASAAFQHYILKVLTRTGVEDNRYQYLEFNPAFGNGRLIEAFVLKEDGSRIQAQRSGRKLAFPGLSAGDFLVMNYRVESFMSGKINNRLWSSVLLGSTYPIYNRSFHLIYPEEWEPVNKYHNIDESEVATSCDDSLNGYKDMVFTVEKSQAFEMGALSPSWRDFIPWVDISTVEEWGEIIEWYEDIYLGQCDTTIRIEEKVSELCDGTDEKIEKIKRIFNFVSNGIEYEDLSFQYSDFIPQTADSVLAEGFGDCKDQSILLVSMLKAAGIDSYVALSSPGYDGEKLLLPSPRFSHVMVVVPLEDRVLYLDPTTTWYTYGELPVELVGTPILQIKDGGELIRIEEETELQRTFSVTEYDNILHAVSIEGTMIYQGVEAGIMRSWFSGLDLEKRNELFSVIINEWLPGFTLKDIEFRNFDILSYDPEVSFSGTVPSLGYYIDNGLYRIAFPRQNILGSDVKSLLGIDSNENGISISSSILATPNIQTTVLEIPAGYAVYDIPRDLNIDFGDSYIRYNYKTDGSRVICTREVYIPKQLIAEEDISDFQDFLRSGIMQEEQELYIKGN